MSKDKRELEDAMADFRSSTERMYEYDFEELMEAFLAGWKARDKQESK